MAFLALATATLNAQSSTFEVASVKQHKYYTNADFRPPTFLPGGRFTSTVPLDRVIAAAENGVVLDSLPSNVRAERMRPMLQKLLAERFQPVIHRETRGMPLYVLLLATGGPKLEKADIEEMDCKASDPIAECHMFFGGGGRGLHARAVDMSDLVHAVETWTGRPLIDLTDLLTLFQVFEGLGLRMEARRGNADVYVIDRIERPAEN